MMPYLCSLATTTGACYCDPAGHVCQGLQDLRLRQRRGWPATARVGACMNFYKSVWGVSFLIEGEFIPFRGHPSFCSPRHPSSKSRGWNRRGSRGGGVFENLPFRLPGQDSLFRALQSVTSFGVESYSGLDQSAIKAWQQERSSNTIH